MGETYARLYHRFGREFPEVYADDHLLAWWTRLLIVADASWPMHPPVPRAVPERVLNRLLSEGLIVTDAIAYTVRGLDAERTRRRDAGARGAAVRWQSDGNATAYANGHATASATPDAPALPVIAEQNKAQQSSVAREGLPNLDSTVARIWEETTGRSVLASGAYVAEYLDEACRRHKSPSKVGSAIYRARKTFDHIPDGPSMVAAMRPILDPFPDPKATAKAERERELAAASRRGTAATLRRNHELGGHENQPHGACPACQEVTA